MCLCHPNEYYFDNLNGEDFELYLKSLFENLCFSVEITPTTGDYGADLVLQKSTSKIVVQAKRYSTKVGTDAVQEVLGAIHYYKASKGMVVTNNYFTQNATELAKSANIALWDRNRLISMSINALAKLEVNEFCEPTDKYFPKPNFIKKYEERYGHIEQEIYVPFLKFVREWESTRGVVADDEECIKLLKEKADRRLAEAKSLSLAKSGINTDEINVNEINANEFYLPALKFLIVEGKASVSMLQRHFRIRYHRASMLIEDFTARGYLSVSGTKHEVLITREQYRKIFSDNSI